MTEEDLRRADAAQRQQARREERRVRVQSERDREADAHFERVHRALLGYAPSPLPAAR